MINFTIYENKNSSQWVTFVHGAGGSSSIWFKQIRDFKNQYNVLLLDLRGHGQSKAGLKTAFKNKYTFSSLSNDILEVLNHLKIEKSHFNTGLISAVSLNHLINSFWYNFFASLINNNRDCL